MDIDVKIKNISKSCIICCHPFTAEKQPQNETKIIRFCEEICKNEQHRENGVLASLNFGKDVTQLENQFGMSVCSSCLIVINELLTSKENVSLLERHVIFLQKQIIQGLRDLEECLEKVKGYQGKITETVKSSDGLCLKNRFVSQLGDEDDGKAEESKNFVFKLRQRIRKGGPGTETLLRGDLSIADSGEPDQREGQERILIKVEMHDEEENDDQEKLLDDFGTSGKLSDDESDQSLVSDNFPKKKSKRATKVKHVTATGKVKTSLASKVSMTSTNNVPISKDGKGYVCDLCDGKVYRNRLSYKKHLNWHKGERNYKCDYCPKSFFRGDYLKDHIRTHTGERPFICDVCGKGFTQCVSMKKHRRNVHNR